MQSEETSNLSDAYSIMLFECLWSGWNHCYLLLHYTVIQVNQSHAVHDYTESKDFVAFAWICITQHLLDDLSMQTLFRW